MSSVFKRQHTRRFITRFTGIFNAIRTGKQRHILIHNHRHGKGRIFGHRLHVFQGILHRQSTAPCPQYFGKLRAFSVQHIKRRIESKVYSLLWQHFQPPPIANFPFMISTGQRFLNQFGILLWLTHNGWQSQTHFVLR